MSGSTKGLKTVRTAFEKYVLREKLGEGGSGTVYRAEVEGAGDVVAVKLLDPSKATGDKLKRFKNEILFGSTHRHPGIVQVLGAGLSGERYDVPFYVMPYYKETLRDLMKRGIPSEEVLRLFSTALDALEAAHMLSVVHRDIKPENILFDQGNQRLVIGDFGIARFGEEELYTLVETDRGARLANFQYAAPEQRERGKAVDHRADIHALGLILNEMFTSAIPHGTGYTLISRVAPQFGYLDALVEQMLRQNPAERPGSVTEIKAQLIARQNKFVVQQRIDQLTNTVVPVTHVTVPARIEIVGGDVGTNGLLLVKLSAKPTQDWLANYRENGRASFIMGHNPEEFDLANGELRRHALDHQYQQIIETLREALRRANDTFPAFLEAKARAAEKAERQRLESTAEAERIRLAALNKLTF